MPFYLLFAYYEEDDEQPEEEEQDEDLAKVGEQPHPAHLYNILNIQLKVIRKFF